MHKLLKISYLNIKNLICSREFLLGIIAAFSYSMLWVLLVHPPKYELGDYAFELGRFLYVVMLYAGVSILRNDIKFNTTKNIFTGIFSRTEIMFSKIISLIMFGITFYIMVEINNLLTAFILWEKIGIVGFLTFNHLHLFISYIAIVVSMGGLMLLIESILFSEKKSVLFIILIFSMINFYTTAITTYIGSHPEAAQKFSTYMKTPFYNTVMLMQGNFNMNSVLINILWSMIFFALSIIIVNKREIN